MSYPQRLHHGRALGYISPGPDSYDHQLQTLQHGCAELGLTLVGVITDTTHQPPDTDTADAVGLDAADIDCVAVTALDHHTNLDGVLAGLPVVVLTPTASLTGEAHHG
jgi:hypothetical protein